MMFGISFALISAGMLEWLRLLPHTGTDLLSSIQYYVIMNENCSPIADSVLYTNCYT